MFMRKLTCLICERPGIPSTQTTDQFHHDLYAYDCPLCGRYTASFEFAVTFDRNRGEYEPVTPFLSAATRQASEDGRPLTLTMENWEDLANAHSQTGIVGRLEMLLTYVARKCERPGANVLLMADQDYAVCDAATVAEFQYYVKCLVAEKQWLYEADPIRRNMGVETGSPSYGLTIKGWEAVEPRIPVGGVPGTCFVAMWFDPSMQDAYELGFKLGIQDKGFTPLRVDQTFTNKGITDEIKAGIRRAQFTVADFTGQRQSVYFEAGFALGLGREVIWCCRKDDLKNLHFDIKHLGHVVWDDPADLRQKMGQSIDANIIPKR